MPDWLATYRPQLWTSDLEDPLEVYYFGRFRWREACQEWALGGQPKPSTESPRLRATDSVNTFPVRQNGPLGGAPTVNKGTTSPVARPIKLH
ncbi:hypothetical protein [Streptomyces sp. NBC_01565]|uniref:hypothetical protein n=1 Tax=Streptomyces sp. NBC_01565 TaxID=2975881 RepID=UPI0022508C3D|nr:hypothetical protein [Streptomyces sp. NBC_01565]MCX4541456.1 hypothetical protein [Streptomyces sp. NBC_01565]